MQIPKLNCVRILFSMVECSRYIQECGSPGPIRWIHATTDCSNHIVFGAYHSIGMVGCASVCARSNVPFASLGGELACGPLNAQPQDVRTQWYTNGSCKQVHQT